MFVGKFGTRKQAPFSTRLILNII